MKKTKSFWWFLQRVTGVLLFLFLTTHIWIIHKCFYTKLSYSRVLSTMTNPWLRVMSALMLACVLFHALNGLRNDIMDFGISRKTYKILNIFFVIIGIVVFLMGIQLPMMLPKP
ncbi:MAG: succinate dehydrogenase, cytochrome b556 subunit [Elusimicrobiota bacterium]